MDFSIVITKPEKDYELLDSGEGEKLERYGNITVARPDPQALWKKHLAPVEWQKAQAVFCREKNEKEKDSIRNSSMHIGWDVAPGIPQKWHIELADLKFWIKLTAFKHTGIFPEQANNWMWIEKTIKQNSRASAVRVLNLFGYTGGATLAALKAGAEVTHVDGSKSAIAWAKENAELSGLGSAPVRWIADDARSFVKREIKRGKKYDAIIMDPPAFGRGAKGEVWKLEDDLLELLDLCRELLSDKPLFFLINGYASGYSAIAYRNAAQNILEKVSLKTEGGKQEYSRGNIEAGEMVIEESGSQRLLPAGIFSRLLFV